MSVLLAIRRWWVKTFRTRIVPTEVNRNAGKIIVLEEGGEDYRQVFDFVPGYEVSRPDWWTGGRSGVKAETVEEARRRLDEWQDDMARRAT